MGWRAATVAVLSLLTAGYGLASSDLFLVQHIEFEGQKRVPVQVLRHLSDLQNGISIWGVSPQQVSQRVARHPWIARAEVRRSFPDTVQVQIEEHQVAALVAFDGRLRYVDDDGDAFLEANLDDIDHPILEGITPDITIPGDRLFQMIVRLALALIDKLDKSGLVDRADIASVVFESVRGFRVRLSPYGTFAASELLFGFEHTDTQIEHLRALLAHGEDLRLGLRIDLAPEDAATVEELAQPARTDHTP